MARPSNKKVARAARTTGGRTARGATPWGFYSVLAIVVVLGTVGIYQSRTDHLAAVSKTGGDRPKVGDHWHAALGVYECDHFAPNVKDSGRDPHGMHTHGDGIVHIHPFDRTASGGNATLKVFVETESMQLTATSFKLPGEAKTYRNGDKCKGKTGEVQFYVNGKRWTGNPAQYRPKDQDLLVLAFVPPKTKVPTIPPSAPTLSHLSDVASTTTTRPASKPGSSSTTAGTTASTTATTAAPSTTATTKKP
jgi:hypothetical protein